MDTTSSQDSTPGADTPKATSLAAVTPVRFPEMPACHCSLVTATSTQQQHEAEQAAEELKKQLTITNQTSSQKRAKASAADSRTSAKTLGTLGIALLVLVAALMLIPDLITLGIWLDGLKKKKKKRRNARAASMDVDESCEALNRDRHVSAGTARGGKDIVGGEGGRYKALLARRKEILKLANMPSRFRRQAADPSIAALHNSLSPAAKENSPSRSQAATKHPPLSAVASMVATAKKRSSVFKKLQSDKKQKTATEVSSEPLGPAAALDLDLEVISASGDESREQRGGKTKTLKKRRSSLAWTNM